MRRLVSLLSIPCLASALTLTRVSTPMDGSTPLNLSSATRLADGTWIVQDDLSRSWYSTDKGGSWKAIPEPTPMENADIMGEVVVNETNDRLWTPAKGWHDMVFPASWSVGPWTRSYVGSEGVRAKVVGGTVHYWITSDAWETWTELLSHDAAAAADPTDPIGHYALGKVWFFPADSGYGRGTADGRTWTRIAVPSFAPLLATSQGTGGILSAYGFDLDALENHVAYSLDSGRTWVERPFSEPGSWIVAAQGGVFASGTMSGSDAMNLWLSPRIDLGWERVGPIEDVFFDGSTTYVVQADGIYRVDNLGTAVQRSAPRAASRLVREAGVLVLLSDASDLGKPWTLVSADGSRIASGTVTGPRLTLPGHVPTGWLRVGGSTIPLNGL